MTRWLMLVASALVLAPSAHAQRNAYQAEGEVARLLADARAFYDNLELDAAEQALDRAIRMGRDFGIRNRTMADVYIQRGILTHVRDKNSDGAVSDFVEALTIDPAARLDPLVRTPSLERLMEEARRLAQRGPPPDTRPPPRREERPPPPRDPDIIHDPIRQAQGGKALTVSVEIAPRLNRDVYRVNLFYRSIRTDSVQNLEMKPEGPRSFVARVPGREVAGRELTYYIVAEDRTGRPLSSLGTVRDPLRVDVVDDALGNLDSIPSGDSLTGDGFGDDEGGGRKYVSVGLSLGTGAGFISDLAEPENQRSADIRPGLAVAPFHLLLEIDVWATDWFAIGAFLRLQIVEFTHLEGARFKFKVVEDGDHSLVLRVGGGFGRVRHLVDLGGVLDTTLEGPFSYTLGASYVYRITDTWGFHATPDFFHLIGDSPSLHFDVALGAIASF